MLYNFETRNVDVLESLLLSLSNEFIIDKNLKSIEYAEVFEKVKFENEISKDDSFEIVEKDKNLTGIIEEFDRALSTSTIDLSKSFKFFDKSEYHLISLNDFKKILNWIKVDLNKKELQILIDEISNNNNNLLSQSFTSPNNSALITKQPSKDLIDYRKLNNLLKIHRQHINIRFDQDIWMIYGKKVSLTLLSNLNKNFEYIKEPLQNLISAQNPLLKASMLEQILRSFKEDFSNEDIETLLKYAVYGSANSVNNAYKKMRTQNMDWNFEDFHVNHFLK